MRVFVLACTRGTSACTHAAIAHAINTTTTSMTATTLPRTHKRRPAGRQAGLCPPLRRQRPWAPPSWALPSSSWLAWRLRPSGLAGRGRMMRGAGAARVCTCVHAWWSGCAHAAVGAASPAHARVCARMRAWWLGRARRCGCIPSSTGGCVHAHCIHTAAPYHRALAMHTAGACTHGHSRLRKHTPSRARSDFKANHEKRRAYNRHYALKGRGRKEQFRQTAKEDGARLMPKRGACPRLLLLHSTCCVGGCGFGAKRGVPSTAVACGVRLWSHKGCTKHSSGMHQAPPRCCRCCCCCCCCTGLRELWL